MSKSSNSDHATTDRLSQSAHESVESIARNAGKAEERIRHEADDMKVRAKDAGKQIKERTDESLQSVTALVRDNPVAALGVAFAAGILVTVLRRRRS